MMPPNPAVLLQMIQMLLGLAPLGGQTANPLGFHISGSTPPVSPPPAPGPISPVQQRGYSMPAPPESGTGVGANTAGMLPQSPETDPMLALMGLGLPPPGLLPDLFNPAFGGGSSRGGRGGR